MSEASATPGPEHKKKHTLTLWLEEHGAAVWWEESNYWDHPQFTIKRDSAHGGIPDLVVELGDWTVVIEFKPGHAKGQVYDAQIQLAGYWFEHAVQDQKYIIADRVADVDGFLTATAHSPRGRLFPAYSEVIQKHQDMSESRQSCHGRGELPPAEYTMTEQHIRALWRDVKRREQNISLSQSPHIGALLSDRLENLNQTQATLTRSSPAILWNRGRSNQDWQVFSDE